MVAPAALGALLGGAGTALGGIGSVVGAFRGGGAPVQITALFMLLS